MNDKEIQSTFSPSFIKNSSVALALIVSMILLASTWTFAFDHTHALLNQVLKEYVKSGKVNYSGLFQNQKPLNQYLTQVATVSPKEYPGWSENEKKAFLINAYNAYTLKIVLAKFPVSSIKDIHQVWDTSFCIIAGVKLSLNQIEHGLLRGENQDGIPRFLCDDFGDARVHMALNCASISCPILPSYAFLAKQLDQQFDAQSTYFVNQSLHVKINADNGVVYISSIFSWFGGDFVDAYQDAGFVKRKNQIEQAVLNFIYKYLKNAGMKQYLASKNYSIKYIDYNWGLNGY